jgi:hypothetical protein
MPTHSGIWGGLAGWRRTTRSPNVELRKSLCRPSQPYLAYYYLIDSDRRVRL